MSSILLLPEVSSSLFIELLLLAILSVAFLYTLIILKNYNSELMSAYQYQLEKRSYLVVTIVWVALLIKMVLLPFFTHTLNELSNSIPGAMCAAGVVSANEYGGVLLVFKIFLILLISLWMLINTQDARSRSRKYFKKKMLFFVAIYVVFVVEIILEILFLTALSTENPVRCCSAIYVQTDNSNPLPFNMTTLELIVLFYLLFVSIIVAAYKKRSLPLFLLSFVFLYIAYYAIVYFFSTYVYELPSHQCPFCLMQAEYYYVGYAIFASLFVATFYAVATSLFQFMQHRFLHVIIWYTIFILVTTAHFIFYLVKNGVFL